jgi:gentisate 1,2-dioxygenase
MSDHKLRKWPKEMEDFHAELDDVNLGPLWASLFSSREPAARPIPYLWKRELIENKLDKAKQLLQVGMGSIERRAVYLVNPGMKDLQPHGWGGATQTLYAAVQAIAPGEIAPSHRHTGTALRFIMEGHGASGSVNGEKHTFEPGDYLITPSWTWHDHVNEGNEPVIWMDCLDVPFIMAMNSSFFEMHPQEQQPLVLPNDYSSKRYQGGMVRPLSDRKSSIAPLGRYKWDLTKRAIDGMSEFEPDPIEGFAVEYINPSNGKDANGRIGARMQKLPVKFHGKAHRHVHSNVYHVYKGCGYTIMNGVRFDWEAGDFFALPAWTWHEHVNLSDTEEAFLFSTNDLPIMEAFDFERQQEYVENGGHQVVKELFQPILP